MNFGYILDIYSFTNNKTLAKILTMTLDKSSNAPPETEMGYNILMTFKDIIFQSIWLKF